MERNTVYRRVDLCETLQNESNEHPIDSSFVLPDYCPDVAAVLKCTLQPSVLSRQVSSDRLIADGQTVVKILYLDEERICVRCCEFTVPFTEAFPLREPGAECETTVTVKPDYVNCRAISPRRLDVHGTVTVQLHRVGRRTKEVAGAFEDNSICCKTETLCWTVPVACTEKSFTVNEVLELGSNHAPAKTLIRTETVVSPLENRVLTDKVIVKGELRMKNAYVSDTDTGAMDCVRHVIPFSQILELPGAEEGGILQATPEVVACEVHINADPGGENRLLSATVKLTVCLCYYRTENCEAVTDAYSTRYPLITEKADVTAVSLTCTEESVHTVPESVELPEGVVRILDLWCTATPDTVQTEDGHTDITGYATLCMLAADENGQVGYFERTPSFTLSFDGNCDETVVSFRVLDTDYQIGADNKLDIKIRLCVKRLCYRRTSCVCVTGAKPDESNPYPPQRASLKIYYAAAGESLWEIARCCHTDMRCICAENGVSGDTLPEETMLLIPYC